MCLYGHANKARLLLLLDTNTFNSLIFNCTFAQPILATTKN